MITGERTGKFIRYLRFGERRAPGPIGGANCQSSSCPFPSLPFAVLRPPLPHSSLSPLLSSIPFHTGYYSLGTLIRRYPFRAYRKTRPRRNHDRQSSSSRSVMGKYNFTALRVRQSALRQKAAGKIGKLPEWVDVLGEIPPSQVVVRNQPEQHQLIRQRLRQDSESSKPRVVYGAQQKRIKPKKASRMFQPMQIRFEEDQLRKEFFSDHPWELARPRILVEQSGKDFEHYDWSRIQQPGKKLDGERYVLFRQQRAKEARQSLSAISYQLPGVCANVFSLRLVLSNDSSGSFRMYPT